MSHTHIRAPKPEPGPPSKLWPWMIAGTLVALFCALYVAGRIRDSAFDTSHLTTQGKVSETRIVVDHILDTGRGGAIFYRVEAHVAYQIEGQTQDRWLYASGVDSSREFLALKLINHPQTCQVYWSPGFPENARCRFP